jgi:F0F1-type ATP synthase delta subunit
MKKKTFNKLIQGPLRFHHQDIHEELDEIKVNLAAIKNFINLNLSNQRWKLIYTAVQKYQREKTSLESQDYWECSEILEALFDLAYIQQPT